MTFMKLNWCKRNERWKKIRASGLDWCVDKWWINQPSSTSRPRCYDGLQSTFWARLSMISVGFLLLLHWVLRCAIHYCTVLFTHGMLHCVLSIGSIACLWHRWPARSYFCRRGLMPYLTYTSHMGWIFLSVLISVGRIFWIFVLFNIYIKIDIWYSCL